jgi:STIP1 family protein 1
MFAKIDDRRRKREVPDYLCGKISFEILVNFILKIIFKQFLI